MGRQKARENANHRAAFTLWYASQRNFAETYEKIHAENSGVDDPPNHIDTLYRWAKTYLWHERADELDKAVEKRALEAVKREQSRKLEQAARDQARMVERHTQTAKILQHKGLEVLNNKALYINAAQALALVKTGILLERQAAGLPDWITEIVGATDDELTQKYKGIIEALGSVGSGDETPGDDPTDA